MGVQLRKLIEPEKTTISALSGKKIAIDAFNTLYQFITTIRQRDGTPLMNSDGKITSHLSGLLYRTSKLMKTGIRPCYVFDGKPPDFKLVTKERQKRKLEAEIKLENARKKGIVTDIEMYSKQSARLKGYMIEDSKKLLEYLGIPFVQAPSEGEAQAAVMTAQGRVWATGSQDFDSLLFGADRLIRNLTITGKRKLPKKNVFIDIVPELIDLKKSKDILGLNQDELICLGILVGTDFNPGGIFGIGPKHALELIKTKGIDIVDELEWKEGWPDYKTIHDFFKNPPATKDYSLEWKEPNFEKVNEFLVEVNDFSKDRVDKTLKIIKESLEKGTQVGLGEWF